MNVLYIGIDVGGTTAKAGVVDEEGKILAKSVCKTGKRTLSAAVMPQHGNKLSLFDG